LRGRRSPGLRDERRTPPTGRSNRVACLALAAATGLTVVVPTGIVGWETGATGWRSLAESGWRVRAFAAECGLSLAVGAGAAALAGGALASVGRLRGTLQAGATVLLIAPGLCGPLVVALVVQAGVTAAVVRGWPGAHAVRDSLAPLIVALALFLLPRAAVLRAFAGGQTPASFLVRTLRSGTVAQRRSAGRLWWGLHGRGAWVRWGFLTLWAAADVSAAAVLLPPGVETAPPGLYNLMHYGHNGVLGALCLLNTVVPALLLAAGAFAAPRLGGLRLLRPAG